MTLQHCTFAKLRPLLALRRAAAVSFQSFRRSHRLLCQAASSWLRTNGPELLKPMAPQPGCQTPLLNPQITLSATIHETNRLWTSPTCLQEYGTESVQSHRGSKSPGAIQTIYHGAALLWRWQVLQHRIRVDVHSLLHFARSTQGHLQKCWRNMEEATHSRTGRPAMTWDRARTPRHMSKLHICCLTVWRVLRRADVRLRAVFRSLSRE